jgi:hypothetical protein
MGGRMFGAVVVGWLAAWAAGAAADDPAAKDPGPATLVDSAGQEIQLTGARFTTGVRRLGWLADPAGTTDDTRKGPLALEVREPHSTTYQKGVVTLIPVGSVEAVRYEYDKQAMTVGVKGAPAPVPGTLQFKGINVCGVEGSAGGLVGKFAGGVPKDGFKSVAFPGAKPLPSRPTGGLTWSVQIDQPKAANPTLTVRNLKALYAAPGGEQLADALPVRKGDPLPLNASLKRLEVLAVDPNTQMAALEVATDGGPDRVVAVPLAREQGGRTAVLVGLLGEVDVGWKLFPLHTIKVARPADKE